MPDELRRAAGQDDAGRQLADAGGADLVAQQLERLAHPRLDDLADLEPADGPPGVLAEDADADLLVVGDRARRSAVPSLILSSSAVWSEVLRTAAMSLVTLLPPIGRTRVWNGEPSRNRARSIVPAPKSATATPSSFSVSLSTASAEASELTTSSSILTPAAATHFDRLVTAVAAAGDDVRLDLEPQRAHPERVLDALLAVDREAAPLDVEHLAVRRDRHGARDVDRPVDVLAADLAMVAGDRDLARRVEALDVLPADADERAVDLPARQPLGLLDRLRDRVDGLVDVDDDALLEARGGDRPVAHDRQPAVAATSPMRAQTLLVPTSMPTRTASRSTVSVRLPLAPA